MSICRVIQFLLPLFLGADELCSFGTQLINACGGKPSASAVKSLVTTMDCVFFLKSANQS